MWVDIRGVTCLWNPDLPEQLLSAVVHKGGWIPNEPWSKLEEWEEKDISLFKFHWGHVTGLFIAGWITIYFYLAKVSVKSVGFYRSGLFALSVEKK